MGRCFLLAVSPAVWWRVVRNRFPPSPRARRIWSWKNVMACFSNRTLPNLHRHLGPATRQWRAQPRSRVHQRPTPAATFLVHQRRATHRIPVSRWPHGCSPRLEFQRPAQSWKNLEVLAHEQFLRGVNYFTNQPPDWHQAYVWFHIASANGHRNARQALRTPPENFSPESLSDARNEAMGCSDAPTK